MEVHRSFHSLQGMTASPTAVSVDGVGILDLESLHSWLNSQLQGTHYLAAASFLATKTRRSTTRAL